VRPWVPPPAFKKNLKTKIYIYQSYQKESKAGS
jgi:hypothetical protein